MNIIEEQDLLFIQERGNRQNCHFLLYCNQACGKKYRTLVVSSDPAHTLSDGFKLGNSIKYDNIEPIQMREIVPNLHALQVDPIIEIKEQYSDILTYMASIFSSRCR